MLTVEAGRCMLYTKGKVKGKTHYIPCGEAYCWPKMDLVIEAAKK